jgi:hypothetical protein
MPRAEPATPCERRLFWRRLKRGEPVGLWFIWCWTCRRASPEVASMAEARLACGALLDERAEAEG